MSNSEYCKKEMMMAQELQTKPIQDLPWEIDFSGDTDEDASQLRAGLSSAGIRVGTCKRLPVHDASLGAGEIILTIFASAAVKALIDVAGQQIREYLAKHMSRAAEPVRLRVIIRKDRTSTGKHHVIDPRSAAATMVDKFIANICDAVKKVVAS
jgi:hypothetical protein